MVKDRKLISISLISILLILHVACFPEQRRVHFDYHAMELTLCKRGSIHRLKVYGRIRGDNKPWDKLTEISALKEGSQNVTLVGYNKGYNNIIPISDIKSNYEYRINIPYFDNQFELVFFTDSFGRIDSVLNFFDCNEHND